MTIKIPTTRPFNLEHARAGAPVAFGNAEAAEILKWDLPGGYPILALRGDLKRVERIGANGMCSDQLIGENLVMVPLGQTADDTPVFVGDRLEQRDRHNEAWILRDAQPMDRDFATSRWPAPAKDYPVTTMRHDEMFDIYCNDLRGRGYIPIGAESHGLEAVTNAGLRHAIEAGQVMLPGGAMRDEDILSKLKEHADKADIHPSKRMQLIVLETVKGLLVTEPEVDQLKANLARAVSALRRAGFVDNGGEEWKPPIFAGHEAMIGFVNIGSAYGTKVVMEYLKARLDEPVAARSARDMAVAEAVRNACREAIGADQHSTIKRSYAHKVISSLSLVHIICKVPA